MAALQVLGLSKVRGLSWSPENVMSTNTLERSLHPAVHMNSLLASVKPCTKI